MAEVNTKQWWISEFNKILAGSAYEAIDNPTEKEDNTVVVLKGTTRPHHIGVKAKKNGRFGDEDDFYRVPLEEEDESLEEVTTAGSLPSAPADNGVGIGGSSIELKVVHSEKFEDVVMVAEHLLNHCTVVLNLDAANKDVRRRIFDFLSGVAFSIGGQIKRVTENTYIITPSNVDVSESHVPAPMGDLE